MYSEDDLLPISALQHLLFCERRVALVYLEQLWIDNQFTAEGQIQHERVHESGTESRGDIRSVTTLRLRSLRLGLIGQADLVEFHRMNERDSGVGVRLDGVSGLWQPVPVEYKRGRLRHEEEYEVQLCAQAMCLEEMLGARVPVGALFYAKTRRRLEVPITPDLRSETERAVARLHELTDLARTPPAEYGPKCKSCSLIDICLPETAAKKGKVGRYLSRAFETGQP